MPCKIISFASQIARHHRDKVTSLSDEGMMWIAFTRMHDDTSLYVHWHTLLTSSISCTPVSTNSRCPAAKTTAKQGLAKMEGGKKQQRSSLQHTLIW